MDTLSRCSHGPPENDLASQKEGERICQFALYHPSDADIVPQGVIQAICDRHMVINVMHADDKSHNPSLTLVESLCHQSTAIPDCFLGRES